MFYNVIYWKISEIEIFVITKNVFMAIWFFFALLLNLKFIFLIFKSIEGITAWLNSISDLKNKANTE